MGHLALAIDQIFFPSHILIFYNNDHLSNSFDLQLAKQMCTSYDECLPNNQLNLGLIQKKTKYWTFFCVGKMIFIIACSFCLFCLSSLPDEGFTLPNWPARRGEAKFSDTSKYSALSWAWICKLDQTIHYLIEYKAQNNLRGWSKMYCHFNNITFLSIGGKRANLEMLPNFSKGTTQFLDGLVNTKSLAIRYISTDIS